jgi:hypothetical protein
MRPEKARNRNPEARNKFEIPIGKHETALLFCICRISALRACFGFRNQGFVLPAALAAVVVLFGEENDTV